MPLTLEIIYPELVHPTLVRCPSCRRASDPVAEIGGEALESGAHSIECPHCRHRFTVETDVRYSFTSPAIEVHL